MSGVYTYYACDLATGLLIEELPLTGVSGARHLDGQAEFNGQLDLGALNDRQRARDLLAATVPMKNSIVLDRDGKVVGEWIIWRRTRAEGKPMTLSGNELFSFGSQVLMPMDVTYTATDQHTIAAALCGRMFNAGLATPGTRGSILVDIPAPPASGVLRDRTYAKFDGTVGQRLEELSQVVGGFEYVLTSYWGEFSGYRYVKRRIDLKTPGFGSLQTFVFEQAPNQYRDAGGETGAVLSLELTEDGRRLVSQAVALGAGEGVTKVVGNASTTALVNAGYPKTSVSRSYTTVTAQATIDSHAQAVLALGQTAFLPPTLDIYANGYPGIDDLALGDTVQAVLNPSDSFPDGFTAVVRVLGWTYQPPTAGVEVVTLVIQAIEDEEGQAE